MKWDVSSRRNPRRIFFTCGSEIVIPQGPEKNPKLGERLFVAFQECLLRRSIVCWVKRCPTCHAAHRDTCNGTWTPSNSAQASYQST